VAEEYSDDGERVHSQWGGAKAPPISKEYAISFDAQVIMASLSCDNELMTPLWLVDVMKRKIILHARTI